MDTSCVDGHIYYCSFASFLVCNGKFFNTINTAHISYEFQVHVLVILFLECGLGVMEEEEDRMLK